MANDYEDVYIYALQRMKSAEVLSQDSRQKDGFYLHTFASSQGHFGSGEIIEFKARICDQLAAVLEETPLAISQNNSEKNESGYREIKVTIPNSWQLRWWILGEGERIVVLEPLSLRQEIIRTLKETGKHYQY